MKLSRGILILMTGITLILQPVLSQETSQGTKTLNLFMDCFHCDMTYVRQELPFISFVRDPQLADIHILVTESQTGGGGNKFFLNFIGMKDFNGNDFEYTMTTNLSDTDDDIRKALIKPVKAGVLQYFSKAGLLDQLDIRIEGSEIKNADEMTIDRWNKWVFQIETGSEFQKEESQNEYSLDTEASIEKITEKWKLRLEGSYEINRENFYDEGEKITNEQDSKDISTDYIRSLTEKWSAGLFGEYSSQTFLNIKNSFLAAAGIEYDFFPWSECNRRVFAVRYMAGAQNVSYMEETIYDKISETLFGESLILNLQLIQPWGEIRLGVEGRHYFHDFSKTRLVAGLDLSLRVTKNLSVFSRLETQVVHDQLYLPKGDASLEDILLRRRKLATTYEIAGEFGFRFTFGSIYNNVVNERFIEMHY